MNYTISRLQDLLAMAPKEIVVDTEHLPDVSPDRNALLGVSIAWSGFEGLYIPINHWEEAPSSLLVPQISNRGLDCLAELLATRTLNGWNIEHDRAWIDHCFHIKSVWNLDGRILWYLTDKVQNSRGYGLKRAQVELLGWPEAGDRILNEEVMAARGSLLKGQHYLASIETLADYARLDAHSTQLLVTKFLTDKDDTYSLLAHHNTNRDYAAFLAQTEKDGVLCNEFALRRAILYYQDEVEKASANIRVICSAEIAQLESTWLEQRLQGYKTARGAQALLSTPRRHPHFNPNSSHQRVKLFHDVLRLPVFDRTKTGLPKSDKNTIKGFNHPAAQSFVKLSENEKLLQFAQSYLQHSANGRIRFPHDTVATVSERLGGYAPYDLNMPFNSKPIMSAFSVREGCVGIHMDLVSIEPCLIAGFSGDEAMLKVYRDGLGDIYLDLCLDLFPLSEIYNYEMDLQTLIQQFHSIYNSKKAPNAEIKETFKKLRNVSKIVQLAVGYTGTAYTVSKNLTKAGFPTTKDKAEVLVQRYWQKFNKVHKLASQLTAIVNRQGFITGLYGRRLYVPKAKRKDALNRFAQHGGHAILREIVLEINRTKFEGLRPLLPDIHDSTSWECPIDRVEEGLKVFEAAIRRVNASLSLPVAVRGEIKQFTTFWGLKGRE
jgi:DNA polymerase I-like protein with 3'-5' exonuclease and polymerase domains